MTIEVGGNLGLVLVIFGIAACIWSYRRNR